MGAALEARTVYVKGFNNEGTTLDELLDYFNENNSNVVSIQMRNYSVGKGKDKEWKFKGSIFVTFKSAESATEFVENKEWKYKDREMILKFQKNYLEDKQKEIEEKKKNKGKSAKVAAAVKDEAKESDDLQMPRGAVIKLTGLGGDITREDIKEVLSNKYEVNIDKDKGDVAFVTYEWSEAEDIKEHKVECKILEGDEEEKFLAQSVMDLKNRRNKNKGHKRKGANFSHGGKRGRR